MKKLGEVPASLRLEPLAEGRVLQTLHVGSYGDEGPILARLHDEVVPGAGPHVCRSPSRDLSQRPPARPCLRSFGLSPSASEAAMT